MTPLRRIPFKQPLQALILGGVKTATVRRKPLGQKGDTFLVGCRSYTITEVTPTTLGDVDPHQVGFRSQEELFSFWRRIYGHARQDSDVWLHRFVPTPTLEEAEAL